jgi:hypothetical protein
MWPMNGAGEEHYAALERKLRGVRLNGKELGVNLGIDGQPYIRKIAAGWCIAARLYGKPQSNRC